MTLTYLRDDVVELGKRGILNVMKAFGMLEGDLERQPVPALPGSYVFEEMLRTNRGGLLRRRKSPGEKIRRGEVVADMMDVWGEVVEQVTMPFDGYLWTFRVGMSHSNVFNEGEAIAYAFREKEDAR